MANEQGDVKCRVKPFVLIIRDGWGHNDNPEQYQYDATRIAETPTDDRQRRDNAY